MIEDKLNDELETTINYEQTERNSFAITQESLNKKNISLAKSLAELINQNPELISAENILMADNIGFTKK